MKYPQLVSSTTPASLQDWLEEELENRGIDGVYTRYILSLLQQDVSDFPECEHQQTTKLYHKKNCLQTMNTKEETVPYSGKSKHKRWKSWEREKLHKLRTCSCSTVFALDSEENRKSAVVECLKSASDGEIGIEMLVDELCFKLKTVKTAIVLDAEENKDYSKSEKNGHNHNEEDGVGIGDDNDNVNKSPQSSPHKQAAKYYAAFPALSGKSEPLTKLCHQQERGYDMKTVWDGKKKIVTDPASTTDEVTKHNSATTTLISTTTTTTGTLFHSEAGSKCCLLDLGTVCCKNDKKNDLRESKVNPDEDSSDNWFKDEDEKREEDGKVEDSDEEKRKSFVVFPNMGLQGHQINTKARCYSPFGMLWSHCFSLSSAFIRRNSPLSFTHTDKTVDDDNDGTIYASSASKALNTSSEEGADVNGFQDGSKVQDVMTIEHVAQQEFLGHACESENSSSSSGGGGGGGSALEMLESKLCQSAEELDEELLAKLCSKFDNLAAIWNDDNDKERDEGKDDTPPQAISPPNGNYRNNDLLGISLHLLPLKEEPTDQHCSFWMSENCEAKRQSPYSSRFSNVFSTSSCYNKKAFNNDHKESLQENDNLTGDVLEDAGGGSLCWRDVDDFADLENSESDNNSSSLSILPQETQRSSLDSIDSCLSSPVHNGGTVTSGMKESNGKKVFRENYMLWDQRIPDLHHLQMTWSPNVSASENVVNKECSSYDLGFPSCRNKWDVLPGSEEPPPFYSNNNNNTVNAVGINRKKTNCTLTYHRGESRFVEVIPRIKKDECRSLIESEFIMFPGKPLQQLDRKKKGSSSSPISKCSSSLTAADEENLLTSPKTHFQPIRQESLDTDTSEDAEVVSITRGESTAAGSKQHLPAGGDAGDKNAATVWSKKGKMKQHSCEDKSPEDSSPQWCNVEESEDEECDGDDDDTEKEEEEEGSRAVSSSFEELVSLIGPFEASVSFNGAEDNGSKHDYEQDLQFLFSASWKRRLDHYEDKGVNTDFPSSSDGDADNNSTTTIVKDADTCAVSSCCWSSSLGSVAMIEEEPSDEDRVVEQSIQSLLFDDKDEEEEFDGEWLRVISSDDGNNNSLMSSSSSSSMAEVHWKWGSVGDKIIKWSTGADDQPLPLKHGISTAITDILADKFKEKNLRALREEIKGEEDELFKDLSCLDQALDDSNSADDFGNVNHTVSVLQSNLLKSNYRFSSKLGILDSVNETSIRNSLNSLYAQSYSKWQDHDLRRITSHEDFIPPHPPPFTSSYCSVDAEDSGVIGSSVPSLPSEKVFYSHDLEEEWKMDSQTFRIQVPRRQSLKPKASSQKRPCSFYLEGNCRRSDCKFSHDLASITCRFWEEGSCFKGITCPFLHGYGSDSDESSTDTHSTECTFALESESDFPSLAKSVTLDLCLKSNKSSVQQAPSERSRLKKKGGLKASAAVAVASNNAET